MTSIERTARRDTPRKDIPPLNVLEKFPEDKYPREHASLLEAKKILGQIASGEIASENALQEIDTFLRQPEVDETFLTTDHPDLNYRPPIAVLRERVNWEREEAETEALKPSPEANDQTVVTEKRKGAKLGGRDTIYRHEPISHKLAVIREKADIGGYPADLAELVHLPHQSVVNIDNFKQILDPNLYPKLKIIQVPPSFKHLIGPGIRQLLEERGEVKLRFGRIRDSDTYHEILITQQYRREKRLYQEALRDSKKRARIAQMIRFELDEPTITSMYYGEKRVSVWEIAQTLGLPYRYAQRKLWVFKTWMGISTKSRATQEAAKFLIHHLDVLERSSASRQEREELRQQYKVGETFPPETLPVQRWEMWQKLTLFRQENPKILEGMKNSPHEQERNKYIVLSNYFQLDGQEASSTLDEIGKQLGDLSRGSVHYLRNKALSDLGLLEDE